MRGLPLSAPPPMVITQCAPLLRALRARGGTVPPLAGPPPPARFRGARLRVARFSPSPPLSGQSGVAPCGRGLFLRLTLQGLTAGWARCARVRWAGGALLFGRVARKRGCGRHSRRSCALQPSARCVLSAFVRARFLAPFAPAQNCVNSKSSFKIYRPILYRTMNDFDYDFKLTNDRHLHTSSGRFAPLTHPPP